MTTNCPECDNPISLDRPIRGEIVVCSDCGTELEVVSENPVRLELAPREEEDWGE
jgi:alpha-aminoadipate carrier protein LysW